MNFGLNTAVTGLLTAQRGLYTASHNVDNTTTEGYSRQIVSQSATDAYFIPKDGFLGTGTNIYNIERVRDTYLDFKYRNEASPTAEWNIKNRNLDEIQKTLAEPSENSFRQYMDDFYKSIEDLTKNPGDMSYREPVRENAKALVNHVNETATRLEAQQKDILQEARNSVDKINSLAVQIAELNRQIHMSETGGRPANDLRDRRDLMVDEIAKYASVNATESSNGKYDVSIGGISLVSHVYSAKINLVKVDIDPTDPNKNPPTDGHTPYQLQWDNGGKVDINSGELKGAMDLYNGNGENNSYRGIRFYKNKLDEFAQGFSNKFNVIHRAGYTYGPGDADGVTGINFFAPLANSANAAFNMSLSDEIKADISNIAAADDIQADPENNKNALALLKQRESITFFEGGVSQGTPEDFIKSVISIVGVDKQQSQRFLDTQKQLEFSLRNRRTSVSGVNLDEEMGDMVRFQKVYTAAAKMLTTMDALLEVTVNRLGLVGR